MFYLAKVPFKVSAILFLLFVVLEYTFWDRSLILEGTPIFSLSFIFRSILILIIALYFAFDLIKYGDKIEDFKKFSNLEILATISGLVLSAIILSILIYDVELFSKYSLEDDWVEYWSAILSFVSSGILIITFFKVINIKNWLVKWSIFLIASSIFVLAMEEISWFQRILEFESPEIMMKANMQQEANFHNFFTNYFENIYYLGVFVFLSLIPFINIYKPEWFNYFNIDFLIPGKGFIMIGCIAAGYNYDMWNVFFMQFVFYMAIVILIVILTNQKSFIERFLIVLTLGMIVFSQIFFLLKGSYFYRPWDVTEYRELLLPLGLVFYSILLYSRVLGGKRYKALNVKPFLR